MRTQVTATSLTASTASATMEMRLDALGGPLGFDLVNLAATTKVPLVGTTMGTSACTSSGLIFAEGNPPFSSAAAPYNGTFAPYGDLSAPDGTFKPYKGRAANGEYDLYAAFLQAPLTFQCFVLELDLQ